MINIPPGASVGEISRGVSINLKVLAMALKIEITVTEQKQLIIIAHLPHQLRYCTTSVCV